MHLFFKTKQNKTKKASVLQCSAFFIVQLLHPYMTTGKAIALTFEKIRKDKTKPKTRATFVSPKILTSKGSY